MGEVVGVDIGKKLDDLKKAITMNTSVNMATLMLLKSALGKMEPHLDSTNTMLLSQTKICFEQMVRIEKSILDVQELIRYVDQGLRMGPEES